MAKTADRKVEIAQRIKELACDEHGLEPEALIFDALTFTLTTGDDEWKPSRDRDDRRHPPHQGRAARRQDVARRLQRLLRRLAAGARGPELGLPAPLRGGRTRPGDGQPQPHHALLGDPRRASASWPTTSSSTAARTRWSASSGTSSPRARRPRPRQENPTEGMEPEEALHWHILRRKKEGVEDWIDRCNEKIGAVPTLNEVLLPAMKEVGDKFGAGELILPFVLQSAEVMKRAVAQLEKLPRPHRGPHEGHRRDRDGVRRRARHRQVAGQHDPHQQRLHGGGPGQAGPDLEHPRGRAGARRDGDRPERAARLDLQADAAVHPGAARARARVPRADRRRGDQPRLRPAHAVPEGQGVRRGLRARASSTARTPSPAWP